MTSFLAQESCAHWTESGGQSVDGGKHEIVFGDSNEYWADPRVCRSCTNADCSCSIPSMSSSVSPPNSIETNDSEWTKTPYCTQNDCVGPSDLSQYGQQELVQYAGMAMPTTCEDWLRSSAQQHQQQQQAECPTPVYFSNGGLQEQMMYDASGTGCVTRTMWDPETKDIVEAAFMHRPAGSTVHTAALFAVAGSGYVYNPGNHDRTYHDNLQLDQHVLNLHVAPRQKDLSLQQECATESLLLPTKHAIKSESLDSREDHLQYLQTEANSCEWVIDTEDGQARLCGEVLDSNEALTEHIKHKHVGCRKKEYTCRWRNCDRGKVAFPQKQKIMRHMVVHTNYRPFQCRHCDYRCSEQSAMKQHFRKHSGEKPFECSEPDCGKRFRASTSLSVHVRTHTGDKPLMCKICGKKFGESSNMAKHVRTHAKDRPHCCDIDACKSTFQRPDQLKRHKKSVHYRVKSNIARASKSELQ